MFTGSRCDVTNKQLESNPVSFLNGSLYLEVMTQKRSLKIALDWWIQGFKQPQKHARTHTLASAQNATRSPQKVLIGFGLSGESLFNLNGTLTGSS